MARTKSSRRAIEGAASADPRLVTPEMIANAEAALGEVEMFSHSKMWALQKRVLLSAARRLTAQREGLIRNLGRPGKAPVTTDQLAAVEGELRATKRLLKFPETTSALWREQLSQMRARFAEARA